jgi:hypothetical protein
MDQSVKVSRQVGPDSQVAKLIEELNKSSK